MGNNTSRAETAEQLKARYLKESIKHGVAAKSPTSHSCPSSSPTGPASAFGGDELPLPNKDDLDTALDIVMDELGLSEEGKNNMRGMSDERKWMVVQQHIRDRGLAQQNTTIPELLQLKENPTEEVIKNLQVVLRSRPISWISAFINAGGLRILSSLLEDLEIQRIHEPMEEHIIKCIKALMNNKPGLAAVLESLDNLITLSLALRSTNIKVRTLVMEIFAALCFIPGGHTLVLDTMAQLMEAMGLGNRFDILVKCLLLEPPTGSSTFAMNYMGGYMLNINIPSPTATTSPTTTTTLSISQQINELQVAAMALMNALVCGGVGKYSASLDVRMHLRFEMYGAGLEEALNVRMVYIFKE